MRVLILSWEFPPRVVGGLARHVYDLSISLASQNVEVAVITIDAGNGCSVYEKVNGVDVYRVQPYPLSTSSFCLWVIQMNLALLEKGIALFNKEHFDLIHAHDWLVSYCGRTLKNSYKVPLLSTIHATESSRSGGIYTDEQRYISDVEWGLTYESWRVICCSNYMLEELQRLFQLPVDKLRVIFNGVYPENFQTETTDSQIRSCYASSDDKIIFYVGRLVAEKGVQVLLEAVPLILKKHPQAKFIIAGEGAFKEELEEQSRQADLADRICFTGFINDDTRNQLYRQASVAVFPSFYEPFGIVALEAMAAGTPVIVSDIGGLREIVTHDVNGLKCYPGNPNSLADQINRLLGDEQLTQSLAKEGESLVIKSYTWPEIARQTRQVYQEVLADYDYGSWKPSFFHSDSAGLYGHSCQLTKPGRYYVSADN